MSDAAIGSQPWYRSLNRSQWNTLIASNLGWLFDGYETYALVISVGVALRQLLDPSQYSQISVYAGTVIAKILTNFSIAGIMYWAVGFAIAFGGDIGHVFGTHGFFLRDFGDPQKAFPIMGLSDATIEAKWFFQFVFCAVSLAIVWGTTLERIKFGVYAIYAVVFAGFIYPMISHWLFGGGDGTDSGLDYLHGDAAADRWLGGARIPGSRRRPGLAGDHHRATHHRGRNAARISRHRRGRAPRAPAARPC